jgi:hypothetical protein
VDSAVAGKFACNGGESRLDLEKLSCVFGQLSANSRHRRAAEFAANCRGEIAASTEIPADVRTEKSIYCAMPKW